MKKIEYKGIAFQRKKGNTKDIELGFICSPFCTNHDNFSTIDELIDRIHEIICFDDIDYVEIYKLVNNRVTYLSLYVPNEDRKIHRENELYVSGEGGIKYYRELTNMFKYLCL